MAGAGLSFLLRSAGRPPAGQESSQHTRGSLKHDLSMAPSTSSTGRWYNTINDDAGTQNMPTLTSGAQHEVDIEHSTQIRGVKAGHRQGTQLLKKRLQTPQQLLRARCSQHAAAWAAQLKGRHRQRAAGGELHQGCAAHVVSMTSIWTHDGTILHPTATLATLLQAPPHHDGPHMKSLRKWELPDAGSPSRCPQSTPSA